MTFQDFIAGKYGLSHGTIAVGLIAAGAGIGCVLGNVVTGVIAASSAVTGAYYMREVVQGHSWNPRNWSQDGQLDAALPALVSLISIAIALNIW